VVLLVNGADYAPTTRTRQICLRGYWGLNLPGRCLPDAISKRQSVSLFRPAK
jgi:hypothetical protein